jgi:hypothetical protein
MMELMKQNYFDIMLMPVKRFNDLIKWKSDLEEERNKLIREEETKRSSKRK